MRIKRQKTSQLVIYDMGRAVSDTLVQKVGFYRVHLRLSVVELAKISQINRSTVTKIEANKQVDAISALKVLDALLIEAKKFNQNEIVKEIELQIYKIQKSKSPGAFVINDQDSMRFSSEVRKNVEHIVGLLRDLFHSGNLASSDDETIFYIKDNLEHYADKINGLRRRKNNIK